MCPTAIQQLSSAPETPSVIKISNFQLEHCWTLDVSLVLLVALLLNRPAGDWLSQENLQSHLDLGCWNSLVAATNSLTSLRDGGLGDRSHHNCMMVPNHVENLAILEDWLAYWHGTLSDTTRSSF